MEVLKIRTVKGSIAGDHTRKGYNSSRSKHIFRHLSERSMAVIAFRFFITSFLAFSTLSLVMEKGPYAVRFRSLLSKLQMLLYY